MIGELQWFTFDNVIWAKSVKITTLTVYSAKFSVGYAEIVFYGNVPVPGN